MTTRSETGINAACPEHPFYSRFTVLDTQRLVRLVSERL